MSPATLAGVALVDEVSDSSGVFVLDDRWEGLEVEHDEVGGVLGDVAVDGDDQRDGIADEADLALGQRRLRGLGHAGAHRRVPGRQTDSR